MNQLQISDVGVTFVLTFKEQDPAQPDNPDALIVVDISSGTSMTVEFRKPDGSTISRTGTLYTTGTDGKLKYTTIAGDIDISGTWELQGKATIGGWNGRSNKVSFVVKKNVS